ncbi:MAG: hypothetical protein DRJ42_03650 [Deltaproteobacteria bacterium]|nr:MAG: hypothetical protein DRJ42_03650 [Deltaproteobacteria bacterium]
MKLLSFIVFLVLQIAFLPLAVVGFVLVAYKQMVISKRLGVSQTAIEVLNGRWTMHVFGMREDEATDRLAEAVPNTSPLGLWLVLFPVWVKYKISGSYFGYPRIPEEGAEGMADLVIARTFYFDRILERAAPEMEQFVLLGAGYDTRAYGMLKRPGLAIYEVDQKRIQEHKVASLADGGIEASHVTFVPVDFSKDDAFEELQKAGYDPEKKTMFIWEGVTLYLAEADVRRTLADIRDHSARGSVVAVDLYDEDFVKLGKNAAAKKTLAYTNEGFDFGLPLATDYEGVLKRFAESEKLEVGETFFMRKKSPKGPFVVVAELIV